ncbi:MAG TPA: DegT/DnrJ/EryC1/StrS family aminotransferase [Candidatus Udaeobacter sp.]|nr:DegT/DnrJ/EryC1/StrS family aminotransferase [Candidatus Udaeobacter sp.]
MTKSDTQTPAKMQVPAMDLAVQHAALRDDLLKAAAEVLDSGVFILGPKVEAIERDVAKLVQVKHAVAVASGTDALILALRALDIGAGDEVITSAYSFFASAGAIALTGAKPVFVDIEPKTWNLAPEAIAEAITPRTRAILPVHLFGQCADMPAILDIARARKLAVVEDAAQALGATDQGRQAGSMGEFGCFSFYPTKNLGGLGDGGIVTTNDDALADRVRLLRVHGSRPKYVSRILGVNSRLDALQAAFLLVKLPHLGRYTAARRAHAEIYTRALTGTPITPPIERPGAYHIYNQYAVRVQNRDQMARALAERGVGTAVYYPGTLPLQEALKDLGHRPGDFPEAERAAEENLCLPIFPELTAEAQRHVIEQLIAVAG